MVSDYYDDDVYDDDNDLTGTDLVKSLRKQLNAAQKKLRDQESALYEYQVYAQEAQVSNMLANFGLNPNIARYVSDDVRTEEDLIEWLDVYGEDFGIGPVDEQPQYADDPDVMAAESMYAVEEGGYDPEVGLDLANRIEAAGSPEELMRILGQA